jgi:hypothetical protein
MTEVRSYNGHDERSGSVASRPESGTDFVAALQDAVRENAISAALIGMGVAWMFMGGRNVSLFSGGGRRSIFDTAGQAAEQFTGAARNRSAALGANIIRATQAVMEPAADVASRTAARTADAGFAGYQATTEAVSRSAETISNATNAALNAVQKTTANWSGGVQRTLADVLERQPLLLGAVGLAIGAGIAASIPITEAEKKVMGDASDFVRGKVSEKAAEVTGQVKEMASAAMGELKAQGITPEGW